MTEIVEISPNAVKNHLLKAMKSIRGHWGESMIIVMLLLCHNKTGRVSSNIGII